MISVVVPTCGRPALLLRCLQALLAQTLAAARYEILVVDDGGGADATRRLVNELASAHAQPRLRYLLTPGRRGPAAARNAGWQAAHGELVAFTDDDTVPLADWLAEGERAMQPPWVAMGGRVVVPRGPEPPTDHARMTEGLEDTEFVTANAFVRRDALQRVGGFDERFTRAWREDSDLQFRLLDAAGPVGRAGRAVVVHPVRRERWGVSLRQQKNALFEALLFKKHPQRYRRQDGIGVPWDYYAIVGLTAAAAGLAAAGVTGSALVSAALALALVLQLARRRLARTSRRPGHVLEMLATSCVIPFLSVGWRLAGAWRWKVWFL